MLYAEEDWRGNHAWARYKRELEAKGEKLDWKDCVPAPVPDDQNFAMTPFLAPLFQFNPKPLQPGQSIWRDTNGNNRIHEFIDTIKTPDHPGSWTERGMTDLSAWAAALDQQTNAAGVSGSKPRTRAEAAAEMLKALQKDQPVFEELRQASLRPSSRFNLEYDADYIVSVILPHLAILKGVERAFQARALAELEAGQTNEALADTKMCLYLPETIKDEPFLISKLVQIAIVQLSLQPVWEGFARHKWSDVQLERLDQRLAKIKLLTDDAFRGERAFSLHMIDQLRALPKQDQFDDPDIKLQPHLLSFTPGGWMSLNQLEIARLYQELIFPSIDASNQRVYPARVITNDAIVNQKLQGDFSPLKVIAKMLYPAVAKSAVKFAFAQTCVNEARVACGLERYWVAHGQYPETLDAISPQFMRSIPHDVIGGEALKYHRTSDGRFILYSVGWNEKDDGGVIGMSRGTTPSIDIAQGDWVWQYPAK